MIKVGASQDYARDGRIPQCARMKVRGIFYLTNEVGRGSGEEPRGGVSAKSDLGLCTRLKVGTYMRFSTRIFPRIFAHSDTVSASAIPLREAAPGRRTEDPNVHLRGVRVLRSRRS